MRRFASCLFLLFPALSLWGQRGYPRIETVFPGAVARGASTEVTLTGRYNLRESTRILFDRPGLAASIIEWQDLSDTKLPADKRKPFEREGLRMKVDVATDTVPGIYGFRILTKGSLSSLAHVLVTSGECAVEAEPNNSQAEAQVLQRGTTVNGRLDEDADLDVYRFEAAAGDRIAFLVHASRLQRPVPQLERDFSDIILTLHDEKGTELASADDSLTEDPELSFTFPKAGAFYLRLREARYHSGKDKWWYALSALSDPVIRSVFPPVVGPGQKVKLNFGGFQVDGLQGREIQIPPNAKERYEFQLASNRIELGIASLPAAVELDSHGLKDITIPAGVNGRLISDGAVARYRFSAKAGQRFEFEVQARLWGSSLDALMEIRDVNGQLLVAQDDMVNTIGQTVDGLAFPVSKDPRVEWTAPADSLYEVHVRDANFFGGPDRFYFFSARRAQEDFALVVDDDRMPVGPGESVTAIVTLDRRNGFQGPVRLFVRGLPEGVYAHESIIAPHLTQANIVITARPDAKPDARAIVVGGRAVIHPAGGKPLEIERIATPFAPMGQAGGRSFFQVPTAMASVSEGSDIILEAEPKAITIERGKAVTVKIRAIRNNYAGPVEMNIILWNLMQRFSKLPAGLIYEEKHSKTSLGPKETEGYVTFRAESDAPLLNDHLLAVMGQITYNRIYMTRVAAPFRLTIR